jgi:hypothetical protein
MKERFIFDDKIICKRKILQIRRKTEVEKEG